MHACVARHDDSGNAGRQGELEREADFRRVKTACVHRPLYVQCRCRTYNAERTNGGDNKKVWMVHALSTEEGGEYEYGNIRHAAMGELP